jgi:hypothetical protein
VLVHRNFGVSLGTVHSIEVAIEFLRSDALDDLKSHGVEFQQNAEVEDIVCKDSQRSSLGYVDLLESLNLFESIIVEVRHYFLGHGRIE